MITFFVIFGGCIAMLLAVQAMDVESMGPRRRRPVYGAARKIRMPFRLAFRDMLESKAR